MSGSTRSRGWSRPVTRGRSRVGEDLHRRLHWIWCLRRICGGVAAPPRMVLVAMVKRRGDAWAKRQAVLVAKKVGHSSYGREEGIAGRQRDRWVAAAASR